MKEAKVDELFLNMDKDTQLKVARVMYELNQRQTSVEKLADIKPIVEQTQE